MNFTIVPDEHLLSISSITSHTLCLPSPFLFIFTQSLCEAAAASDRDLHGSICCTCHSPSVLPTQAARGTCRKGRC